MKTYKLAVSGYVLVEVQAENEEQAQDVALNTTVAGELYDYEFNEVTEVTK